MGLSPEAWEPPNKDSDWGKVRGAVRGKGPDGVWGGSVFSLDSVLGDFG